MNRVLDVYDQLRIEGKIKAAGASIKGPNVTQATSDLCLQYIRSGRVDAIQVIYSIFRQRNQSVFDEARSAGVGIVARTVLENGFLTGKYAPGHEFSGQDHRKRFAADQLLGILREVQELDRIVVKPPYEDIGRAAIRFVLDEPNVSTAIIGVKTVQQARENMMAASLPELPADLRLSLIERYRDRCEEFNTSR
jgi:aryl-alcohol dehydrogenase-like predicted oxidoreductase